MKTLFSFLLLAMLSFGVRAAETLTFKFSNPQIIYNAGTNYFTFDIFIKATAGGTYLYSSQVICNVDIANFNISSNPSFLGGIVGSVFTVFPNPAVSKYLVSTSWNSNNLNIAVFANPTFNGEVPTSGAYSEITTSWQLLGTVYAKISNTAGVAGINFQVSNMNGYQKYATGIAPFYSDNYNTPNNYEGINFTDLYLGRIYNSISGWTQAGGTVNWSTAENTSVWDVSGTPAQITTLGSTANSLRIHLGAQLKINPGLDLTCTGPTEINEPQGLWLASDASGTGSFIDNGTVTYTNSGSAKVDRYVTGDWNSPLTGWHLLSSPVAGQDISGSWIPTGSGYDMYTFYEPNLYEYWLNQKVGANNITTFLTGKGYLASYEQTDTKSFTGNLNVADVTLSGLTNTPGSANPGFQLVGNPFASAINWTTGTWSKTNIDAIAQVWDETAASYKTTTEKGNIIPAMNGFMIHTTGSGALTIPADARVHNTTNWYKSTEEEFILLNANDLQSNTSQSSIVRFNPQATETYDNDFDSYFLPGYAPMFYSKSGIDTYSLNTLPGITESLAIPFGFVKNASSDFTIELSSSITGEVLFLQDRKTDLIQNLTESPVYTFTSEEGDDPNRFVLHFLDPTGVKPGVSSGIQIYTSNKTLYVNQTNAEKGMVTVFNSSGQVLRKLRLEASASQTISLQNFTSGVYVVAVQTGKGIYNQKVIVR